LIALIIDTHHGRRQTDYRRRIFIRPLPSVVRRLVGHDLERPACFIRPNRRRCGQASPTLIPLAACAARNNGECAPRMTGVIGGARIDLLFTMSDKLHTLRHKPTERAN